jgi:hypothetical protein
MADIHRMVLWVIRHTDIMALTPDMVITHATPVWVCILVGAIRIMAPVMAMVPDLVMVWEWDTVD